MIQFDMQRTDFENLISKSFKKIKQLPNAPTFANYQRYCSDLFRVKNIGKLLKTIARQEPDKTADFLTELRVIHQLATLYSPLDLQYEPTIYVGSSCFTPDIELRLEDSRIYIQIKHIRKSKSFDENRVDNSDGFICADDVLQIRQSLLKATSHFSNAQGILVVMQEASDKADMGQITFSDALYGKECIRISPGYPPSLMRKNDGFFYNEGKYLTAHILLHKIGNLLLSDYKLIMRPNPLCMANISIIRKAFPIHWEYSYTDLPKSERI